MSHDPKIFTYKARVHVTAKQDAFLAAWAQLHGTAERQLAQPLLQGEKVTTSSPLYKSVRDTLHLSDRNANAALTAAQGRVKAAAEARNRQIEQLEGKIARAEKVLASGKIRTKPMTAGQKHHKKRRLAILKARLERVKAAGPKLCFGSRRLFRAQFNLDDNGYASHQEWLADWRDARSGEIFIVGRNSETAGNATCQAVFTGKDFSLRLRVPYALQAQFGSHVMLSGIAFHHSTVAGARSRPHTHRNARRRHASEAAFLFPILGKS